MKFAGFVEGAMRRRVSRALWQEMQCATEQPAEVSESRKRCTQRQAGYGEDCRTRTNVVRS